MYMLSNTSLLDLHGKKDYRTNKKIYIHHSLVENKIINILYSLKVNYDIFKKPQEIKLKDITNSYTNIIVNDLQRR